ncbi:class I SAM-dependent methyltransferase [Lederbergia sp. NSJ-179]|uniref:class I SAM-dependent DNA methyltransferase n=1 Tax=Lederbergia sp. NSJ-179 TaxID=2931402 RepID=UPI001FD24A21|nr:class I SAM-dependent methyltransferase [Lederbergia sp. NSJ-179]MCJ7841810.1 class I SAM-dependent methyltransferase [Lederbergia sp. NSJ-179]
MYGRFAQVYDSLMSDVPYKKWMEFADHTKQVHHVNGKRILELACGTGELSILLAQNGYNVTGVDLSPDMLMVAREKAEQAGINLELYEQDMSNLEGLGTFDIVTIFCDSLNYVPTPDQVRQTFQRAYAHLENKGLFLFDVHSAYKIENIFMNQTFSYVGEEISYIWDCYPEDTPYTVEHDLTFFLKDDQTGQYDRFEESHVQRTYLLEDYTNWLNETGFTILSVTADFTEKKPDEQSERIFFACQK